jgi:hypothetical protein
MLARAIESELMRGDLEARVWKLGGLNFVPAIHQNVKHPAAFLADEMLMPFYQRVEMLRPADHQYLQFFIGHKFLQVSVNGSEAYVRKSFPYSGVYLVGGRMRAIILDRLPDDFELFGISWFLFQS